MIGTSLITPFFPPFALEKGIHTNLLGFIISANPVGAFLSSIALGKLMNEVWFANYHKKNRFGFIIVGMALQGIGLYLFVTMNWIEESLIIILLATFGRFISGIGTSFFMTPFYAYIPIMYPHEVERRIAISELISGGA
jgi:MFS family permease